MLYIYARGTRKTCMRICIRYAGIIRISLYGYNLSLTKEAPQAKYYLLFYNLHFIHLRPVLACDVYLVLSLVIGYAV